MSQRTHRSIAGYQTSPRLNNGGSCSRKDDKEEPVQPIKQENSNIQESLTT